MYEFPGREFVVTRDDRELGKHSKTKRKLDVTVRRVIGDKNIIYILGEAKYWNKKVGLKAVESFLGMLEDVGASIGIMVTNKGYTKPAQKRVLSSPVQIEIISPEDAISLNYRELARNLYPYDWAFHPQMAEAFNALKEGSGYGFIDALENVPYEEWLAVVDYSLNTYFFRPPILDALKIIASSHPDDGWRFNAVQKLIDNAELEEDLLKNLLEKETDEENLELLQDYYTELYP